MDNEKICPLCCVPCRENICAFWSTFDGQCGAAALPLIANNIKAVENMLCQVKDELGRIDKDLDFIGGHI